MNHTKHKIRCAIYCRKSSEEGLGQSFNSLDAQRQACVSYIESQRHEGCMAVDDHYNDGGYSGGTLQRPSLHGSFAISRLAGSRRSSVTELTD
jgi:site-specific DNA recombinase